MTAPQNTAPVYEVFTQTGANAVAYAGSIVCSQPQRAWHVAKEAYGRRDDLAQLWVVPRDAVISSAEPYDPGVLAARTRMPHRQPAFPQARRKRRERAGAEATAGADATTATAPATTAAAAPPVPAGDVPATLWRCLADDLFLHAHRLSERIVDYVELETSLAVGSVAQEDLAHARNAVVLCGLDPAAVDDHFYDRDAHDWFPSRLLLRADESWLGAVARGLVLSAAATVAARATLDPASTIEAEQLIHFEHWSGMAAAVLGDPGLAPELAEVFAEVWDASADLFHAPSGTVGADGVADDPVAVGPLQESVTELLATAVPADWLTDRGPAVPRRSGADADALVATLGALRSVRSAYPREVFA